MVIDQHMKIWRQNEEPIDILHMPYQSLKVSVQAAAARARTKAEWIRNSSKRIATAEIDRTASQIDPKLTEEQQGIMRTVAMGGDQALQEIANYNEDIDPICTHCGKAPSTVDHLKWECEALEHVRIKGGPYHCSDTQKLATCQYTVRHRTGNEARLLYHFLGAKP